MNRLMRLPALILWVSLTWAHPHFLRQSSLDVGQGAVIKVQHVTVPYNEANPQRLKVGDLWTVPSSKFTTPLALASGESTIAPGDYQIALRRTDPGAFGLVLIRGDEALLMDTLITGDLSLQDHLLIDLRPTGDNVFLDLRFGRHRVSARMGPQLDQ